MRVVLDTNILFSALISPHGAPDSIYRAWRSGRFNLVTSRAQLEEIRRASRYPKLQAVLQPAKVGVMINNLQRSIVLERLPHASMPQILTTPSCWRWLSLEMPTSS